MPLTFTSFASTLGGLSVPGVQALTSPPQRMPSGNLPVGYPRLPTGGQQRSTLTSEPDLDQLRCDYVILVETVTQNMNSYNYAAALAIMDGLHAALKAEMAALHAIDGWDIRMEIEVIAEIAYWAIITTVRASA
jgi:hypothetical protein